jgi:hypothetical protein
MQQLTTEDFYAIMKFLMAFIEKEKQTESLLEKLCHRFDDRFHLSSAAGHELEFPMRKAGPKPAAAAPVLSAAAAAQAVCAVNFVPASAKHTAATGDLVCVTAR